MAIREKLSDAFNFVKDVIKEPYSNTASLSIMASMPFMLATGPDQYVPILSLCVVMAGIGTMTKIGIGSALVASDRRQNPPQANRPV